MPILNRAYELQDEIAAWRRRLHANPEINYDVFDTAAFVAEKLREFGCDEVVEGIGRTGVVGVIAGRGEGPTLGLRADMDALPMIETTGLPHASTRPGAMHACGHDGHTAMLLGAARHLAETRNFNGRVAVIFQPAEEGGAGGLAMVKDGMMDRFAIRQVYGLHNLPGLPVGTFAIRSGAIMASTDEFNITVAGKGAHAAFPHQGVDPVVAGAQIVVALQTIAARNADPLDAMVVSTTMFHAGSAFNVIPGEAELTGTLRSLKPETRALGLKRIEEVAKGVAAALGAEARVHIRHGYPVTVNHGAETQVAAGVAADVAGDINVDADFRPTMGGEDFSYMLQARPGAFIFMGNGDSAPLHNTNYDFNDDAIPHGVSYWVRLVETALA